jgi:site-specific recombinase XerD
LQGSNVRSRALDDVVEKLEQKKIPGKEYVEGYLRNQYRRNCKANTLWSTFTNLDIFLSFMKASGKFHLEQITREDLFAFIEHEQDRGMRPVTVHTRLVRIKAFIHFLVEQGVVRGDMLTRRLTVKVPDSLPRAMEPVDVKELLSVIDNTRDRAMIVVLLRTGMRIGELLSLLVREVNLKERRSEGLRYMKLRRTGWKSCLSQ